MPTDSPAIARDSKNARLGRLRGAIRRHFGQPPPSREIFKPNERKYADALIEANTDGPDLEPWEVREMIRKAHNLAAMIPIDPLDEVPNPRRVSVTPRYSLERSAWFVVVEVETDPQGLAVEIPCNGREAATVLAHNLAHILNGEAVC